MQRVLPHPGHYCGFSQDSRRQRNPQQPRCLSPQGPEAGQSHLALIPYCLNSHQGILYRAFSTQPWPGSPPSKCVAWPRAGDGWPATLHSPDGAGRGEHLGSPLGTVTPILFLQARDGTQEAMSSVSQRTKSGGPKPADPVFVGGKTEGPFVPGTAPSCMPGHVGAGPVVAAGCLFSCPAGREMPHASTLEARQGGAYPCVGPHVKTVYVALPPLTAVSI